MKIYENLKSYVNVRSKIKKSRLSLTWRRRDNVQIKQTSYHIRNKVKYRVKTGYLNGKIPNGSE